MISPTPEEREAIDCRVPGAQGWAADEHRMQCHIMKRFTLMAGQYPELTRCFAVPNGGHRHKAAAGKMKAEGQKPGVPDLCLPIPRGAHHGLWVELKRGTGTIKESQWDWLTHLHRNGYRAAVANCPDVAVHIFTEYLNQ
jgi:hypothetical protein